MEVGYLGFELGLGFGKNFDLYILLFDDSLGYKINFDR